MHFSHLDDGSGSKLTKIILVAAFHVVLAILLINSMNMRTLHLPKVIDEVTLILTPEAPPPPPPEPPKPVQQVAPSEIVVPKTEVVVEQAAVPLIETTTTVADPAPLAAAAITAEAAPSAAKPGVMHTAMLADADGCAKPDYPARAARMGETGTVTLALLVGVDGRVATARVARSSGSKELDRAALAALSLCKFKPATVNGVAEQGWGQIAYVWTLDQ